VRVGTYLSTSSFDVSLTQIPPFSAASVIRNARALNSSDIFSSNKPVRVDADTDEWRIRPYASQPPLRNQQHPWNSETPPTPHHESSHKKPPRSRLIKALACANVVKYLFPFGIAELLASLPGRQYPSCTDDEVCEITPSPIPAGSARWCCRSNGGGGTQQQFPLLPPGPTSSRPMPELMESRWKTPMPGS